ncbi:hypothetical protein BO94DRAFT_436105, partial [Aspergillus sclerotioniger CBS 115572]
LLKRFAHPEAKISQPEHIGIGEDAITFKFKHGETDLCLKVFKPWKYPHSYPSINPTVEKLIGPFSRECRAFARLCDMGLNGTWAVRCHGWIYLSDSQMASLRKVYPQLESYDPYYTGSRWAIVKDFLSAPPTKADLVKIREGFDIAKQARILPHDLEMDNYKGSVLMDLGCSTTYPFVRGYASTFEFDHFFDNCIPYIGEDW